MYIVRLNGGLGNQMFQYAFGRRLSLKHKRPLFLDPWYLIKDPKREYEMGCFVLRGFRIPDYLSTRLQKFFKLLPERYYYSEKNLSFDRLALKKRKATIYEGYWQSYKYFFDTAFIISEDFNFRNPPSPDNSRLLEKIKTTNSVSVHVRRGDYVNEKRTREFHGIVAKSYYKKAFSIIEKKVENPTFFFFSDEINWVKKNFVIGHASYFIDVNQGENNNYEDMRLMMNCKHNIIANSSFSWWAAWLNKNKKKIVIAPEKWFNDPTINTKDKFPKNWIKL